LTGVSHTEQIAGRKMVRTFSKQLLSIVLSVLLGTCTGPLEGCRKQAAQPGSPPSTAELQQTGYSEQSAPLSAAELQQLVAPIALYPDALVAQVLGAATFPDQVAGANDWLHQNQKLTGQTLMQAVDQQPWDPSVKGLTQFPSVLDDLTRNLGWTSALGEAYQTQAADVMSAIQVLRARAMTAGNLKSGPKITVVQQSSQNSGSQTTVVQQSPQTSGSQTTVAQQSPQVIVIQPTNPQVVYVPQYNPTVVYGTPVQTPGYSSADLAMTGLLAFGVGIAVGAAINYNSCCGWGYSYWNCNWYGGSVHYRGTVYYGNNAWRGGYYGSTATAYGPYGSTTVSRGYNPSTGTYARGGTVSTPYGSRSAGQAYNPSTGTYARGASGSGPNGSAAAGQAYNPSTGTYARGASGSGPNGSAAAGQAYNPRTGAYAATHQTSNAYGTYGSSVATKNGNTAYTQHQTTAQGSVGTVQTSAGGRGAAATGANGNSAAAGQTASGNRYAAGQTANGNKYAAQNGNVYKDTGSGWQQTQPQKPTSSYSGTNSAAARGYGGQERSSGSSAFGGGGSGWQSRQDSARGSTSRSGARGGRR
jgi:hypothetical protein